MEDLTPRQAEILRLINDFLKKTGFPPTRAEIAKIFGFSSANAAEDHLRALEKKGHIELLPGASRGIRLKKNFGLPLIGRVAAGSPILAEANVQARYQLDRHLFSPHADYLLKVRGLSMRDAGILDGDLLAVHSTREVRSGQIIVARLGNDVTVKRLKRQGNQIQLLPENPDFDPIDVDARDEQFEIEGLAVGIVRNGKIG
ncbi:MAG: transcriptional repressor LexA [Burkholderiales bacterium]